MPVCPTSSSIRNRVRYRSVTRSSRRRGSLASGFPRAASRLLHLPKRHNRQQTLPVTCTPRLFTDPLYPQKASGSTTWSGGCSRNLNQPLSIMCNADVAYEQPKLRQYQRGSYPTNAVFGSSRTASARQRTEPTSKICMVRLNCMAQFGPGIVLSRQL